MKTVSTYASVLALAGCSVINSFDDVKPALTESGGTNGGGASSGGKSNHDAGAGGGKGGKGGTGGTSATADASTGGGGGSTGGGAGAGGATGTGGTKDAGDQDAFTTNNPTSGALVAYNANAADKVHGLKLHVLDPRTGKSLSEEAMAQIRAVLHDDINDIWYIFETQGTFAQGLVTVHVRELDAANGKWRELGKTVGLPAPALKPSMLTDKIAYLTDSTGGANSANYGLTVISTTDPSKMTVVVKDVVLPAGAKLGLMARGSSIDVVEKSACVAAEGGSGGLCDIIAVRFAVNGTNVVQVGGGTKVIGQVTGSGAPEFVTDPTSNGGVFAMPSLVVPPLQDCSQSPAPTTTGHAQEFSLATLSTTSQPFTFSTYSERFAGSAFDSCTKTLFLTTLAADFAVWALPLTAGGTFVKACDGTGSSHIYFDAYTHSLFRLTDTIQVFKVGGTPTAPTLTPGSLNALPKDFLVGTAAVRRPAPNVCP